MRSRRVLYMYYICVLAMATDFILLFLEARAPLQSFCVGRKDDTVAGKEVSRLHNNINASGERTFWRRRFTLVQK